MNRYLKISAALAAFALLLVVMGLSTQPTVNAQASNTLAVQVEADTFAADDNTTSSGFLCSSGCAPGNAMFQIKLYDGTGSGVSGTVTVKNLDIASGGAGFDANPKEFTFNGDSSLLTAVPKSSDLLEFDIKAFHGNKIQVTYRASGTLGTTVTLMVDNVKPNVVVHSPPNPLVIKDNTNVTFSADVIDSGAGFAPKAANVLGPDRGQLQLFIGQYPVRLTEADVTVISDGYNVSKTINTSDIATLGAPDDGGVLEANRVDGDKVAWHFSAQDRAGTARKSLGDLEGTVTSHTTSSMTSTAYANAGYGGNGLNGRTISVSDGETTFTGDITASDQNTGDFTVDLRDPANASAGANALDGKTFKILNSQLITVDGVSPKFVASSVRTGTAYNGATKMLASGTSAKKNSVLVGINDTGGLDSSTVTPSAFTVTGNSVTSVLLIETAKTKIPAEDQPAEHLIFLSLGQNLGSSERPTIGIQAGVIKDKAGNALGAVSPQKAADGLGPNLTLAKSTNLSNDKVTVTISADELLSASPDVTLKRVVENEGDLIGAGDYVCRNDANEAVEGAVLPTLAPMDPPYSVGTTLCVDDADMDLMGVTVRDDLRQPNAYPSVRQTEAQVYTYAVTANSIPGGEIGGEFNIFVKGMDTQDDNESAIGHSSDASNSRAFTLELDNRLNGGVPPEVLIGDKKGVASGTLDKIEAIDNLIVTVDFKGEKGEYKRDSYSTVELTSAKLKICFADGNCDDDKVFNLTTEVSTADNIKYTIPLLNPKVGTYTLTVQALDQAGNVRISDGSSTAESMASKWEVISAKPVNIDLAPGWNMISLPFQPGNPAINSVIPSTHPADIVMTFDGATGTWLVSRRDAETGLFVGDIPVMTASTAYFVRTNKFQALKILRPPLATSATPPPQVPALQVVKGWNLVPVVSNETPLPPDIIADVYFGTLGNAGGAGWLKALTFNTLSRTWDSVTPKQTVDHDGDEETDEVPVTVKRGKGYWLYATGEGVIIP